MTKTRIFSITLIPLILFLGYLLYRGIAGEIELAETIKKSEARVIEKLKIIREAQKAYLSKKGRYTDNFDSLIHFIKNDSIYITDKREIITQRSADDPRAYLGDSIRIEIDTIGVELVKDRLYPKDKYPNLNVDMLAYVPGYDPSEEKKFEAFADKIEKGGVKVDVVEVVDPYPMNKARNDENPSPTRWRLRFGSKTDVTTSGNWE